MPIYTISTQNDTVNVTASTIVIATGTLTDAQATKVENLPTDTNAILETKVDKDGVKVLTTNDYDDTEKAKVAANTLKTGITTDQANAIVANTAKTGITPTQSANIVTNNAKPTTDAVNTLLLAKADLVGGKVPASQLPDGIDEVLEYANLAAFPATGEANKIYVALDTNLTYRWSGTQYVEISASLALGETSATAYRGDRGAAAYTHSQLTHDKTLVGLPNVENKSSATIRGEIVEADIPVEIARVSSVPTLLSDLTSATTHRTVSDTEKAAWNAKAETSAIPQTTTPLTDTALKRFVSDAEKSTWNAKLDSATVSGKADKDSDAVEGNIAKFDASGNPIDSGSSVTELSFQDPETLSDSNTITFTKTCGVMTTNTNRSITSISGVPGGGIALLRVVGTGTLDFDSLTGLRHQGTLTKKATTDYLVKIINAGTTASPIYYVMDADGGGNNIKIDATTWEYTDIQQGNTTPLILKAASGIGIADIIDRSQSGIYVKSYTPYTANTVINLLSGSTIVATCDCLGATSDGWHQFEFNGNPFEENAALSAQVATGDPTGGNSDVVFEIYYTQKESSDFSFSTEIELGHLTIGASQAGAQTQEKAQNYVMPYDVEITHVSLYHYGGIDNLYVGIYDDVANEPVNQLGISAQTPVGHIDGSWAWQDVALVTPVTVNKGDTIWIAWVSDDNLLFKYETGEGNLRANGSTGVNTLSDPFGSTGTADVTYTIGIKGNRV